MPDHKLNDVFIEQFTGELWYIKQLPDSKGYYLMGDAYGLHPDRQLSVTGLEDMLTNGMLKYGWSAEDAKRWKS